MDNNGKTYERRHVLLEDINKELLVFGIQQLITVIRFVRYLKRRNERKGNRYKPPSWLDPA